MELQDRNLSVPVLASPQATRYILNKFKLSANKKLGQNFLIDAKVVQQITAAAELSRNDEVLEIGPGLGTLTQGLAATGSHVTAVELDKRMLPVLATTLKGYSNVRIVRGDILQLDIMQYVKPGFKCCANLPYYITTPVIFSLLEQHLPLERLVIMVQKEVAERITAQPGGKEYGVLSVTMQYYTEPVIAFTVPSSAFMPTPQVDSAVLVCKRREVPPVKIKNEILFFKTIKAAFSLRRKMLSNSLRNIGLNGEEVQQWLARAEIDGNRRAETLSLQEFAVLADTLQ